MKILRMAVTHDIYEEKTTMICSFIANCTPMCVGSQIVTQRQLLQSKFDLAR